MNTKSEVATKSKNLPGSFTGDTRQAEFDFLIGFARNVTANLETSQVVMAAAKALYEYAPYDSIVFSLAPGAGGVHIISPQADCWHIRSSSETVLNTGRGGFSGRPLRFVELPCAAGSIAICCKQKSAALLSDLFLSSFAECLVIALRNAQEHGRVKELAIRDALTGLYNRRGLEEMLRAEELRRNQSTLSLLVIDLDNFKLINDNYGHPVGDLVLESVSRIIRENTRQGDIVARYGGEEFAVFLPSTVGSNARTVAERLRKKIAEKELIVDGSVIKVTVSIGVACNADGAASSGTIMTRADQAMYQAKRQGKNRVCMSDKNAKVSILRLESKSDHPSPPARIHAVAI